MSDNNLENLRFPIGRFKAKDNFTETDIQNYIKDIEELPVKLRNAVEGLNDEQLNTRYRPEGWTLRQVVHHLPDSHLNSYIRFKLGMEQDTPTVKTYREDRWAEFEDAKNPPVEISLNLIDSLHKRWIIFLRSLSYDDFKRKLDHPEWGIITLGFMAQLYSWHSKHHVAHITSLRKKNNW